MSRTRGDNAGHLRWLTVMAAWVMLAAAPASAHHEAIFGPQSSAVLSPTTFLSAQVFTRELGEGDEKRHETTTVFSAGVRPFKRPVSIAFVVPMTFATSPGEPTEHGLEDALVTARYRVDVDRLEDALRLDDAYVMGVGGIEIPTGTLDHDFGRGPVGGIAAALMSIERHPFSLIGYGYYHHTGEYHNIRQNGNAFAGLGAAWTPVDDEEKGKLFSLQCGLSYERTFAIEQGGVALLNSGGSGIFVHPGIVAMVNPRVQFFALVSLPVTQEWRAADDRQRFRFGAGAILVLTH